MMRAPVEAEKNIKSVADDSMHVGILIASAVFLAASFGSQQWWLPAWISFVPLFLILARTSSLKRACIQGFVFGFVFFVGTIFWLAHVASVGMFVVAAYCALYYAFASALVWWIVFRPDMRSSLVIRALICIPAVFVVSEYIRTAMPLLGFGWALVGYSQTSCLPALHCARIGGVYGVSMLVLLFNVLLFLAVEHALRHAWRTCVGSCVAVVLLCASMVFCGQYMYAEAPISTVQRISVIQPNIPQEIKWAPEARPLIISKITTLIEMAGREASDIIVLPEAVYPGNLAQDFEQSEIKRISEKIAVPIVLGAPFVEPEGTGYNSAFLVYNGEVLDVHHKLRLVPFGEFVPFKPFFSLFGLVKVAYSLGVGDFLPGDQYTLFPVKNSDARYGVLVCFEDTIPSLARTFVNEGASLLVNITNDAWFRDTRAPYQHMQASIMRAVENGVPVVRAANTGVSCIISPEGIVTDSVHDEGGKHTFVDGLVTAAVPIVRHNTLYRRGGFLLPWVLCGWVVTLVLCDISIYIRKRG